MSFFIVCLIVGILSQFSPLFVYICRTCSHCLIWRINVFINLHSSPKVLWFAPNENVCQTSATFPIELNVMLGHAHF